MKALFIGGTGNISTACSRLAVERGIDLYLLNRGQNPIEIDGAKSLVANIYEPESLSKALEGHEWDVVVNWIAFNPDHIERDLSLFEGKTKQYIFISSASAYQKPLTHPLITESTPLCNPYWQYSRDKIACEERLHQAYREKGFPITIVRPSLTYDTVFPVALGGWNDFTLVSRMRAGKRIVSHGDGSNLWTITHADDFAKGFTGLLGHPQTIGQAFHITSDELLTWDQIYHTIADAAGTQADIVHIPTDFIAKVCPDAADGIRGDKGISGIFDNSKIKRFVPEYNATIRFSEGIRRTIAWFEQDPSRQTVAKWADDHLETILSAWDRAMAAV